MLEIPRSTLQHWSERKDGIDADPRLIDFFESSIGTAFLHRVVLATHFVMNHLGACSVRQVCKWIELAGIGPFVAASYGAQQQVAVRMEDALVEIGREESERLAGAMKKKEITVCEDETFHPETCLVAIEPVSDYILVEQYAAGRKASDWTEAMAEAMRGLKVKIVQSTSDEGRGLLHHVQEDLGAHHSPDVFHVQHEIFKATSGPLSSRVKQARGRLEAASEEVNREVDAKKAYDEGGVHRGRPPQCGKKIAAALGNETQALKALEEAEGRPARVKRAVRRLGRCYHPVDLETGIPQETEEVSQALHQGLEEIEAVAHEAGLAESCLKRLRKAKKVVVEMVATIVFVHFTMRAKVEALTLAPALEQAVLGKLIPALYLERVATKAKTAADRERIRGKAQAIHAGLKGVGGEFAGLDSRDLAEIRRVAEDCADLFQRASSCVEGRNGQLSLRHHSFHRLSNRKLRALTVVHNFFIKRRDGTTAAERFFGSVHRDLFEVLLEKVDLPGRPARKRPFNKEPLLMAA